MTVASSTSSSTHQTERDHHRSNYHDKEEVITSSEKEPGPPDCTIKDSSSANKENLLNRPLSTSRGETSRPYKRERSRSRDRREVVSRQDHDHHRPRDHPRHGNRNGNHPRSSGSSSSFAYYKVVKAPPDERLGNVHDDPRGNDPTTRITQKATGRGHGRNTESFDPASTLVRPDLRVLVGSPSQVSFNKPLKHDDVVIVPELFGPEENWDLYYKLVEEMREVQQDNEKKENKGSEWIAWHEGAHLISKNPKGSPTYNMIVDRLCEYFHIDKSKDIGTRFNWYRDSSDWKPFHHDSAAFNPQRAKNQNITIGASFGATRELAFIRAKEYGDGEKCKLYFPQTNNGVFSFGRDANILWKHGVNALPPQEQDGKGRISIILWGLASKVIEEDGSPPLLGSDGKGPHANHNKRPFGGHGHRSDGGGHRGGGDMGRREDRSRHSSYNHHHHHRGRHGGNHGRDDRRDSRRDRNASLSRSPPPPPAGGGGRRSSMERHGPNHHNRGHHNSGGGGDGGRYERN